MEGKVGLGVNGSVKIYISNNTQYVELRVCANASFNVEFVGEADIKVGEFTIPICTGVYIYCTPCLVFGFKAQISIDVELNTSMYYTWDAEYGFGGGISSTAIEK